jgi:hypothetical protein
LLKKLVLKAFPATDTEGQLVRPWEILRCSVAYFIQDDGAIINVGKKSFASLLIRSFELYVVKSDAKISK